MPARGVPLLPSPGVQFDAGFPARLQRLALRVTSARERREGAGRSRLEGGGEEFVGHRPYRPGEDLRDLDWNLLASLDRPYVRVLRREAGERWLVLLDTSASMGVGIPGKLQAAAEIASGIGAVGLRQGAAVRLVASGGADEDDASVVLRKTTDLHTWLAFLEARRAAGPHGLASLLARGRARGAGRVYLLGDLFDVDPARLPELLGPGRSLAACRVLAPEELLPPEEGAVEWVDPEDGRRRTVDVNRATAAAYEHALEETLGRWARAAARHGVPLVTASSEAPFEDAVRELFGA
jgi:uncharacterized protein (DUF58 family)